jgi:hypothetical protein
MLKVLLQTTRIWGILVVATSQETYHPQPHPKGAQKEQVTMGTYLYLALEDGFGRQTSKRVEMTNQLLLADYILNAEAFMTALLAIVDLNIVKAYIQTDDTLTIPTQDPAGSNVDVGATFSGWLGDAVGKKGSLKVPGFQIGKVGPLGVIDLTDVDVAAFLDLFGDPPDNKFRISAGEYVETWIQGTLDK